jgi:hypothetical protein
VADAKAPGIGRLLQPTRLAHGDRHARIELLPDPRHGGEHRRRDLAHVLGHGLGVLDEVQHRAGVDREVLAAEPLGDVAQRQEAHPLVALVLADDLVVAADRVDDAAVRMHRPLGLAGRARGVDEDRQVVGPAGGGALVELAGCVFARARPSSRRASSESTCGSRKSRRPSVSKTTIFSSAGRRSAHRQDLVELLVVLDEDHPGARVGAQVLDLGGGVGRIDAVRDAARRQHGEVGQHPFDHRVGEDRGGVAGPQPEGEQAVADLATAAAGAGPGPLAPETELLLPHEDAVGAPGRRVPEHGGTVSPGMTMPAPGCSLPTSHRFMAPFPRSSPRLLLLPAPLAARPACFMPR